MKAEHFLINAIFAKEKNIPVSFNAIRVKETTKAVQLYGHGAMDPEGCCARCGRRLTHPGSILIGIGPECLGDWGARNFKLDNMTLEEKEYLKSLVTERKVNCWLPKSVIKRAVPIEEEIQAPEETKPQITVGPNGDSAKEKKLQPETKKAREWKGFIALQFPYSYETVNQVKSLEGRKWHPEGKYWTAKLTGWSIKKLKEWGFELDEELTRRLTEIENTKENAFLSTKPVSFLKDLVLKKQLFPYQKEGVAFIEARGGRALVGDEMGLGKTIQALAYLQLHPELRPAVILCPASLKLNWKKEINDCITARIKTQVLEGKTPYNLYGEIIIINYDILTSWVGTLKTYEPKIIIADECHYFKDNGAKRTKAVKLLGKSVPHFIALSGTPIVNRPIEIYNALTLINSSIIPSFWEYAKKYCNAYHNGFGWDYTGASNTEELHKLLTDTIMIRRKKADVLKDLPDKVYSYVPMTLANQKEYEFIERDVIGYLRQAQGQKAADRASNAEIMVQIEQLKQAAVRGKLDSCIDWVKDFIETEDKLVIFATHKFVIDKFMEVFGGAAVKIDGSTTMQERNQAVLRFQEDPKIKIFVGNIKAAGIGLTLTASSNVVFIELPWTPGDRLQAEDRCHRIGQKDTVNVRFLLVEGTIEEEIAQLLDKKIKILDAVLDGRVTDQESLLTELMNKLTTKNL